MREYRIAFSFVALTAAFVVAGCGAAADDPIEDDSESALAAAGYAGSSSIPNPPATAHLYDKLDDLTGWSAATGAASSCPDGKPSSTCNPPNANFNRTVLHVTDPGTTKPANSDGSAALFELFNSPKFSTCIWGHSIGNSTIARHFIWDFSVYVNATDYESSEFDFYQILAGHRLMLGTQCNRAANSWDTWNEGSQHWVHNPSIPCGQILTANKWHRVVMYLTTDSSAHTYTYHTIRIDGVDHVLNQTQPSKASTWPDGNIGLQVQLDANATGRGVNEYVEGMKAFAW